MTKRLDLAGQRFGKLTVLRPAENIGSRTAWVCRCDCGQETIVKTTSLPTGHTKTCGYQRSEENPLGLEGACMEMLSTKRLRKNNTSGTRGVEWVSRDKHWKATICYMKKRYFLGNYLVFEDAAKARKRAEKDLHKKYMHALAGAQTQADNG